MTMKKRFKKKINKENGWFHVCFFLVEQRELQEYRWKKKEEENGTAGTLEGMKCLRQFDKWQQSKRSGEGEESDIKSGGVREII